ncbi:hypothetical protein QBC46DRAFT_356153 [Diplogelasinospora grovesii]|uniref:Uncharacterized protein n=1 Tax=Diplogelasinospora grovesii TaxID=303347 RepID=A0AAN6S320_9PEZI|nr:hypothetical protein QBC46DRAFT_356153 [Diplogelasinospora grovesii]
MPPRIIHITTLNDTSHSALSIFTLTAHSRVCCPYFDSPVNSPEGFGSMFIFQALLFFLGVQSIAAQRQHAIFHGTSIVILPHANSTWPGNATFLTANFFTYGTPAGYLSFGCHCLPHSDKFHWVEYANTTCDAATGRCRNSITNEPANDPPDVKPPDLKVPPVCLDYVVQSPDIGNGPYGRLALSYVDIEHGGYGVGSRQMLSTDPAHARDCHSAQRTFRNIAAKYGLEAKLKFQIGNPCVGNSEEGSSLQKILGSIRNYLA